MIISRTPFRISFFGGGTDYPAWYRENGGAVLSTTIDKYCYLFVRYLPPFFRDIKHRIVWRHVESVECIADILHPAVRETLRFLGFDDSRGLEIMHQGDLPARSGIGSSSSFVVGFLKALHALRGDKVSNYRLAMEAIEIEQDRLKENVGCQDQMAAALGGFRLIQFHKDGGIEPIFIDERRQSDLESRLLLFYSGASRLSSEIGKEIVANMETNRETLHQMATLVDEARDIVEGNGDINEFGLLLDETWRLKKKQSRNVSNEHIDSIYHRAIQAGALGGKLCGAGSSGFILFFVPPDRQEEVKADLREYLNVPFHFESEGSVLLHRSEVQDDT